MKLKKRIGIVGGGQLGRMLTIPAKEMGFAITVVDPTPNCPAAQVGAHQIIGGLTDGNAIAELAKQSDVVTFEIEHINTDILKKLEKTGATVHPSPASLETIKDKLHQKTFLKKSGIATADFQSIETEKDIAYAGKKFGYPFLLKTRHGGYDGRGNALIKNNMGIAAALEKLGNAPLYAEKYVPFIKELAVMVARSIDGDSKTYPVVETIHKDNILHYTLAPAPIEKKLHKKAEKLATSVIKHLGGAGVFGIEMFLTRNGKILVNEIAPRVHNSGHYTIEATYTSQFEQHIRAITGMPLGDTSMRTKTAVMVNILGNRKGEASMYGLENVLTIPQAYVHIYGKKETNPDRKMGHVTVLADTLEKAKKAAVLARKYITI